MCCVMLEAGSRDRPLQSDMGLSLKSGSNIPRIMGMAEQHMAFFFSIQTNFYHLENGRKNKTKQSSITYGFVLLKC